MNARPHRRQMQLDSVFMALADPTRRAIVQRLARGEANVNELAAPFEMSLPAVSKHLKVLENAGLIARGRDAQRRPCRLVTAPLKDAGAWMEKQRREWDERLDSLEGYLERIQKSGAAAATARRKNDKQPGGKKRPSRREP
jgi:DNA-binding transcriptional ArsR family regulator